MLDREAGSLLRELARGVLTLAYRDKTASIVPYSVAMQSVYDKIVASCLLSGGPAPTSVPELLRWTREYPVGELPFNVDTLGVLSSDVLVDGASGMPTRTCIEVASAGFEGGWEREALRTLQKLELSESNYARCADFMANRPVVTVQQTLNFAATARTAVTWRHIMHLYRSPADLLVQSGRLHVCPECRLPARSDDDVRIAWCESGECPGLGEVGDAHDAQDALVLVEPLRAFHVAPTRIAHALRALGQEAGLTMVAHGASGTYAIQFSEGSRSVRIFDRVQPALLAEELKLLFEAEPSALVVVPSRTMARHLRYRRALQSAVPAGSSAAVMTDEEFAALLVGGTGGGEGEEAVRHA
ncbi:hypothetical protein KDL01_26820 [Actinospica durhamensis]|uniref:pPIWI-RE three-gene island domain-containing protein n=1 Tax=Actinospica durhamensis TaxID=1508375 RepID=A0A941ESV5_9ACTN|nr:hypothetical protein [Actinospica durhamensis]MBR7836920.1 hypothetical protein [Actinospica durhamensis]